MELINNRMYMSVKEAAAQTGATIFTVYGWLRKYELPRIRVVGNLMIAQDDLIHFIHNKPVTGRPKKKGNLNRQPKHGLSLSQPTTQREEEDNDMACEIWPNERP